MLLNVIKKQKEQIRSLEERLLRIEAALATAPAATDEPMIAGHVPKMVA